MKAVLLLFMLTSLLFGFDYDEVLLKTQATIFPKIMLLDKKLDEKLLNGKIVYTIIYREDDYQTALNIKGFIDNIYHGMIEEYPYKIDLVRCSKLSHKTQASALYVLNSCIDIKAIAQFAKKRGIISFAYDVKNLKKGLLFSLNIERKTLFYLNKDKNYSQKIEFVDPLLQMVRFVDKSL